MRTARTKFDILLPDEYGPATENEGWVECSVLRATAKAQPPRYRGGNALLNLGAALVGVAPERFTKKERIASIGTFAVGGWSNDEPRTRLFICDTVYTPIRPVVNDHTVTIRHTHARYLISASVDTDGAEHQNGITFDFLERNNDPTIHDEVGYHTVTAPGVSGQYSGRATDAFLKRHGIDTEFVMLRHRIDDVADLCIRLAQAE
jgi:hypothetical protein